MLAKAGQVAAMKRPLGLGVDRPVVAGVAVGKAVGDDEVEDGVGPLLMGDDPDWRRFRWGDRRRSGCILDRSRRAAAGGKRRREDEE
jgi:hypothetical protein